MKTNLFSIALAAASLLVLAGCDYEVPITAGPTRPVDPRLLGDWVSFDQEEQKMDEMSVRQLDEFNYVVGIDHDIYRAFHTDHAGLSFVSVQDLNSSSRKYVYYVWRLSPDNSRLVLQRVRQELVPDTTKDSVAIQKLITDHVSDPKLLDKELAFTRKKSGKF